MHHQSSWHCLIIFNKNKNQYPENFSTGLTVLMLFCFKFSFMFLIYIIFLNKNIKKSLNVFRIYRSLIFVYANKKQKNNPGKQHVKKSVKEVRGEKRMK